MIKHKNTGVNFWKPFFNDLNPFDILDIEDVLRRYKDTIYSFDQCKKQQEAGHYFLRITDDQLTDPRVKKLHTTFNHKNTNLNDLQIIKFEAYGKRAFKQNYDPNYIKRDMPNGELIQLQKDVSSLKEDLSDIKYTLLNPEDGVIVKTNQNTVFRREMQAGEKEYQARILEFEQLKRWQSGVTKALWIAFGAITAIILRILSEIK